MHLCLHPESSEIEIRAALPEHVANALAMHMDRLLDEPSRLALARKVAGIVTAAVADSLYADLQPPTDRQVRFARVIGQRLGVAVPSEAFQFKAAMGLFLDRNAPIFQARMASVEVKPGWEVKS